MAALPSIEKLRLKLNKLERGLLDNVEPHAQVDAYNLAAEVARACEAHGFPSPYGTVFSPEYFGINKYNDWQSDTARQYFADHINLPNPETQQESAWEHPGTLPFERMSLKALGPKFFVSQQSESTLQIYKVEDAIAQTCHPVVAGNAKDLHTVFNRALAPLMHAEGVACTGDRVASAMHSFMGFAPALPAPALLGQPDEEGWCLKRAIYRPDPNVSFPHIEQFLMRLNDAEAFSAWFWGIYSGRNRGRQMPYLHDARGQGGKSKFLRSVAQALFGDRIYTSFPPSINLTDRFTLSHFIGMLLAIIGDCKDAYIFHRGMIKEMSGDDKSHVQRKFEQPFSTTLRTRVIVASNYAPFITHSIHNTSRTLFLTLSPLLIPDDQIDPAYGEKCVAEICGWLAYAEDCYRRLCPNDYAIRANDAVQQATALRIATCEAQYADLFDELFVADLEAQITSKDWNKALKEAKVDEHKNTALLEWTMAIHNTEQALLKTSRAGAWTMDGVRLRTHGETRRATVWGDAA